MVADLREDADDYQEAIRTALNGRISRIQTGMPGIIVSFNPTKMTAVVQPAIQAMVQDPTGTRKPITIAVIADVPVQFPAGGGCTLTFPVAMGDECWLSFSSRSIDNWYAKGGQNPPPHPRQHDLTDAVAHLGFRSQPRVLANVSTTSTQLRTDDGTTYVEVTKGKLVNIVAPDGLTITAPTIKMSGTVTAAGEITAKAGTAASVSLSQHHGHTLGSVIPPTAGT